MPHGISVTSGQPLFDPANNFKEDGHKKFIQRLTALIAYVNNTGRRVNFRLKMRLLGFVF